MSENLKKLISKDPKDYEPAAYIIINKPDVELFSQLVEKEDFLFDFVKQNVANRMEKVCNNSNYRNLLQFLKFYSPSYEEFIVRTLAKFADDNFIETMLEIFENGTFAQKTYCAKFFGKIKNPLALKLLNKYAFSEDSALSVNCAQSLGALKDEKSYKIAMDMLDSEDEFTKLDGVKFLVSFGNQEALNKITETIKNSSMAENIAGEILYLADIFDIYSKNNTDALFIINSVINGLGEILGLAQVFDFRLYEFLEKLISEKKNSEISAVLLNAIDKFNILTENDEYLFDEDKDTKKEIYDIKLLLKNVDIGELYSLIDNEVKSDSLFVFTALEYTENEELIRNLLKSQNPAIIIKSLEILKQMGVLLQEDKQSAIEQINDKNLENIILAL